MFSPWSRKFEDDKCLVEVVKVVGCSFDGSNGTSVGYVLDHLVYHVVDERDETLTKHMSDDIQG